MLFNKSKKIIMIAIFVFASSFSFIAAQPASANDLSIRYLTQATEAFEDGKIDEAYNRVNLALAMAKDDNSNVVLIAKDIYTSKLRMIQENYDEKELIDVQMNLEKYPELSTSTIKKILLEIESDLIAQEKRIAEEKENAKSQVETERFEKQQANMEAQVQAQEKANELTQKTAELQQQTIEITKENAEMQRESNQKVVNALGEMQKSNEKASERTHRSMVVFIIAIIGIAVLILVIVFIVVALVRRGMQQAQERQAQYMQAFQAIAANQNQTTRLMLGGITDLYNSNTGALKIAGSSTWQGQAALPESQLSPEDETDLQRIAERCEEIGSEIDQLTNRKNNSKNVSELVYKVSLKLGLTPADAMLNFCAAMIYDAGFLKIDPSIWETETLSEEQKKQMQQHVYLAEEQLDFVPKKYWQYFVDAAKNHHENIDGSGYPAGLKGDDIPLVARIIRVAETYVSLSSKRNYRHAMDKESAIQVLKEKPEFYDQMIVDVLDRCI